MPHLRELSSMLHVFLLKIIALFQLLWREVAKFGTVGALGWLIDNGAYTLLWHGLLDGSPIKSRLASTALATLFAWFAHRHWTFHHRKSQRPWKEFSLFLAMSAAGLLIVVATQAFSHYVLGYTSFTADFVAGGIVGLGLATIFRFFAFRLVVFTAGRDAGLDPETVREIIDADLQADRPAD